MRLYICLTVFILFFNLRHVFAQENASIVDYPMTIDAGNLYKKAEVDVSTSTGKLNFNIPLYTFELKNLSYPVSINYRSDIKAYQESSEVGLGWSLNGIGMIYRQIKGYPDFHSIDVTGGGGYFMLSNSLRAEIENYVADDGLLIYDGHNTEENSLPDLLFTNEVDIAPDIFVFSVNDISGKFTFDKNGEIIIECNRPIRIQQNDVSERTEYPDKFVIIDEHDIKYEFFAVQDELYLESSYPKMHTFTESLRNKTFKTRWYLHEINTGVDLLEFRYQYGNNTGPGKPVEYLGYSTQLLYQAYESVNKHYSDYRSNTSEKRSTQVNIESISSDKTVLTFKYSERLDNLELKLDTLLIKDISFDKVINKHAFDYDYFNEQNSQNVRLKLEKISLFNNDNLSDTKPYTFTYIPGLLAKRFSGSRDHWNYYNGESLYLKIPNIDPYNAPFASEIDFLWRVRDGESKIPKSHLAKRGLLESIIDPLGKETKIEYEQNTHYAVVKNGSKIDDGPFYDASLPEVGVGSKEIKTIFSNWNKNGIVDKIIFNNVFVHTAHFDLSKYWVNEDYDNIPPLISDNRVSVWITKPDGSIGQIVMPDIRGGRGADFSPVPFLFDQIGQYEIEIVDPFKDDPLVPKYGEPLLSRMSDPNEPQIGTITIDYFIHENPELTLNANNEPLAAISGGLRVAKVIEKDSKSDMEALVTRFDYTKNNISSGILPSIPRYTQEGEGIYLYDYNDDQDITTSRQQWAFIHENESSSQGFEDILYEQITKIANEEIKTVYEYNVDPGYREVFGATHVKFLGSTNTSYSFYNNNLNTQTLFKKSDESWQELQRTEYDFNFTYRPSILIPDIYFAPIYIVYEIRNPVNVLPGIQLNYIGTDVDYFLHGFKMNPSRKYLEAVKKTTFSYTTSGEQQQLFKDEYYEYSNNTQYIEDVKALYPIKKICDQCSRGNDIIEYFQYDDLGNITFSLTMVNGFITRGNSITYAPFYKIKEKSYSYIAEDPIPYSGEEPIEYLRANLEPTLEREYFYDNDYNLVKLVDHVRGLTTHYQYGYNNNYLIAKGIGQEDSNIWYNSFEDNHTNDFYLAGEDVSYSSDNRAGNRSANGNNNQIGRKDLLAGDYIFSYWMKGGQAEIMDASPNIQPVQVLSEQVGTTIDGWTFYEKKIRSENSANDIILKFTGLIDEVKLYTADVLMTTYTHNPLVGITSQTDTNNTTTFYEYDDFNRLAKISNNEYEIIEEYEYNFANSDE